MRINFGNFVDNNHEIISLQRTFFKSRKTKRLGSFLLTSNVYFFTKDVETMKLLKGKEGGANVQIVMASQILERTLRTIPLKASPNALDINCLKGVAGIRAALDVLSQYLDDNFSENMRQFEALSKCLETAKHMCSNSSRSVIQFFLLKQLVRHSGIDAVKERCKRRELNWILPPMLEVVLNGLLGS